MIWMIVFNNIVYLGTLAKDNMTAQKLKHLLKLLPNVAGSYTLVYLEDGKAGTHFFYSPC
jgi:hypothetical protein